MSREIIVSQEPWITRKETTSQRLKTESQNQQSETAGRVRLLGISGRPDRKWTSQHPNEHHAWDCFDDSFLNHEAHQEALDVLDAWKFAPWKGMVRGSVVAVDPGQGYETMSSTIVSRPSQIWVEETTYSGHWECLADQPTQVVAEPPAAPYTPYCGPLLKAKAKREDINRAYEQYLLDPEKELPNLWVAVSSYAPSSRRLFQAQELLEETGAEFYLEAEDIISNFALDVMRRFSNGQYEQKNPFHTWIGFIWKQYFFPKTQTTVRQHMKHNSFMNPFDPEDDGYVHENRTILMSTVEFELSKREEEGYKLPMTAGRVLRELDNPASRFSKLSEPTKAMLRSMAMGNTKDDAAKSIGVSSRHARRLLAEVLTTCGTNPSEATQ